MLWTRVTRGRASATLPLSGTVSPRLIWWPLQQILPYTLKGYNYGDFTNLSDTKHTHTHTIKGHVTIFLLLLATMIYNQVQS